MKPTNMKKYCLALDLIDDVKLTAIGFQLCLKLFFINTRALSLLKSTLVFTSILIVKWISGIQPNYLFQLTSSPTGNDHCND